MGFFSRRNRDLRTRRTAGDQPFGDAKVKPISERNMEPQQRKADKPQNKGASKGVTVHSSLTQDQSVEGGSDQVDEALSHMIEQRDEQRKKAA